MKIYRNEQGYMELLKHVLENGVPVPDRTGIGSRAVFDAKIVYDVGLVFPFSTVRPAPLRLAFEEFWFFLNAKTQTKELEEKGCFFWNGNTTREFLDSRGLFDLPEGDMGKAYGSQLRSFGSSTSIESGFDQLKETDRLLREDPFSRRIYNTMWNPNESYLMALTPCHHSHQFVVLPDENGNKVLNLKLINRSLDICFGLLFAVQQYALFLVAMAELHKMKVGTLSIDLTHVHIYDNQVEFVQETLTRDYGKFGTLEIIKPLNTLDDLLHMKFEDIRVRGLAVNTEKYQTPRPPMAV